MHPEDHLDPYPQCIREMFLDDALGTIDNPNKAGLVAIASLGWKRWSQWHKLHPITLDFSGIDFSATSVNFSEFFFPKVTTEKGIKACVDFSGAKFGKSTEFKRCVFDGHAIFEGCHFLSDANFSEALFGSSNFASIKVHGKSDFSRAQFNNNANFNDASFGESATFAACVFMRDASFEIQTHASTSKLALSDVTKMDFSGARFMGESRFTNRSFAENTTFGTTIQAIRVPNYALPDYHYEAAGPTRFEKAPDFHGCKFHQSIDFHYTTFIQDYGEKAAICYRTLRMAMDQIKSVREEQRFFRMEIKAEISTLSGWKSFLSTLYQITSDYGFSVIRPLALLLITSIMIGSLHGTLSGIGWTLGIDGDCSRYKENLADKQSQMLARYIITSAVPIPGAERIQEPLRKQLFEQCKRPWVATVALLLEMTHKAISLIATFLLGLALRNLFKMKS